MFEYVWTTPEPFKDLLLRYLHGFRDSPSFSSTSCICWRWLLLSCWFNQVHFGHQNTGNLHIVDDESFCGYQTWYVISHHVSSHEIPFRFHENLGFSILQREKRMKRASTQGFCKMALPWWSPIDSVTPSLLLSSALDSRVHRMSGSTSSNCKGLAPVGVRLISLELSQGVCREKWQSRVDEGP